jgi:hypothetical protein
MRALTAPAVLLALVLAGCADAAPTGPMPGSVTFARGGGTGGAPPARPISGHCELTVTPLPSVPPILRQTDTGTCQLSHLGRTAYTGVLEIDLATGTQRGERTLTAANGDILQVVAVGTSTPDGPGRVRFVATLTFVGGTGRFADATGQARAEGVANLATSTTMVTLDGWIAYDASNRSGR